MANNYGNIWAQMIEQTENGLQVAWLGHYEVMLQLKKLFVLISF